MVNRSMQPKRRGEYECGLPEGVLRAAAGADRARQSRPVCRDCGEWKQRLQMIDFALVDLVLYLDAYPHSAKALAYYATLREEREALLRSRPEGAACDLTNQGLPDSCVWSWTDDPWPWHIEANV